MIFAVVLHFTPFGRGIYAIGLSPEAALFSGDKVRRTKLILFVLTGTIAALAGIYYTLRYGSSRGDNATGMELQVIAAVLLGGVSIFGGRGALHGVIGGVLLIGVLASALRLANVTSDVINIITGVLLVLSVVSASLLAWVQSNGASRPGVARSADIRRVAAKSGTDQPQRKANHMKFGNKLRAMATIAAVSLTFAVSSLWGRWQRQPRAAAPEAARPRPRMPTSPSPSCPRTLATRTSTPPTRVAKRRSRSSAASTPRLARPRPAPMPRSATSTP